MKTKHTQLQLVTLALFFATFLCGCHGGDTRKVECSAEDEIRDEWGCTVLTGIGDRHVNLVFSADSMFEGGPRVLDALKEAGVKGSFFFTGNFLRDTVNAPVIRRAISEGHYVGPHSDRHILLADWDKNRTTLIDADSMLADLGRNYEELARFGVDSTVARTVLPPFEWCNAEHSEALRNAGYRPINLTPGIETYRDYTTPDMREYRSSEWILDSLASYERIHGLDGAIMIVHAGTQDAREDKLYNHLPDIIDSLVSKGYKIVRL